MRRDTLSPDMCTALHLLGAGQSPYLGTSGRQRQGRGGTMAALVRRDLVCRCPLGLYWLTDAGKRAECADRVGGAGKARVVVLS